MITTRKPVTITEVFQRYRALDNALGRFIVAEQTDGSLRSFWIDDDDAHDTADVREDTKWNNALFEQLDRYFAGETIRFSAPTPPGPPFFERCWEVCRRIKRGTTISYGELAARAGSPTASRAAGQSMRRNPLPIIVPCHRVVSSTGSLHGFAGKTDPDCAALQRKKMLLELERDDMQ